MTGLESNAYYLLSIVEVEHASRVRCQALGCDHSVYERIHVVLASEKFIVLGSQCFEKLYGGMGGRGNGPYYGGNEARRLTDEERTMLVENTARFIERLETERIEFERVSAARKIEADAEKSRQRASAPLLTYPIHQASRVFAFSDRAEVSSPLSRAPEQYRYMWSSSWWKSPETLLADVQAASAGTSYADVVYAALESTRRQPGITPVAFAVGLHNAGVPYDLALEYLRQLKLVVRAKIA